MGEEALAAAPDVREITLRMPNVHYLPIDLSPFGQNARGKLFVPHGRAERPDRSDAPEGVMGALTTHELDTAQGRPGAGILAELFDVSDDRRPGTTVRTNQDGCCDAPLLEGDAFHTGQWELVFHVGEYFAATDLPTADPPFLDRVTIRFGIADDAHYHVPLLVAPSGYTTYRGIR